MAPPNFNETIPNEIVSTLLQATSSAHEWPKLARSLATILSNSRLDWRDLARALDLVKNSPAANDSGRTAQILDRVAILAMQLSRTDAYAQRFSADILDACISETRPELILRRMVTALRKYIQFDVCTYSEYYHSSESAGDQTYVQSRFSLDGDDEFFWPARWMTIPPELVTWIEGTERYIPDIERFRAQRPEAEALRSHKVAEEYERRGITSFLVAPRIDGGRVMSALTLGRRKNGRYEAFGEHDQQQLDALRVELVLRRVGEAFERQTANMIQEIADLFTPTADPAELAESAVSKLGRDYRLEYVALFRVNRARGLFEVTAQYNPSKNLTIDLDYHQKLSEGMLGQVLEQNCALYAPNVRTEPPPYNYKTTNLSQASAMCLPIRMGRKAEANIEWILDLESSQFDAFPPPEQIVLKSIVAEVDRSVHLWFEARLGNALLNLVDQGVVVLGEETRIERANAAARRLLGLPMDIDLQAHEAFADLESFGADDATRAIIRDGQASRAGAHLRLKGPDGIERRALAGSSYHDAAFNRRVWLLGDAEQKEWVGSLRYMEAAVRTVSAQSHGHLRLASALLRNVLTQIGTGSDAHKLIDRAIRSIDLADLPYERIGSVYDVMQTPLRATSLLVLDLASTIRVFMNSRPPNDVEMVELTLPGSLIVKADPPRLSFALRSLLGYLLAFQLPEMRLRVSLSRSANSADIDIRLIGVPSNLIARLESPSGTEWASTSDKIAYAEARAVAAAAHGLEAVKTVVEAHGAKLHQDFEHDGAVHFVISGLQLTSESSVAETEAG